MDKLYLLVLVRQSTVRVPQNPVECVRASFDGRLRLDRLCDLLFELSSNERLGILNELGNEAMNVTKLARISWV